MLTTIVVGIVVGVIVAYIVITFILPKVTEQLVMMAKEKLGGERQDIKTDLENKKSAFERIFKDIKELIEKTDQKLETSDKERLGSFSQLKEAVENQAKVTEQLSVTTENLKRVLSNNQLRGQFGEQVAENLLKMNGFVKGTDYEVNKQLKDSGTRPDFTIFLPNKIKINIDAKFPYQKLQQMVETNDNNSKKELLKVFESDIKAKIKQVTTRDYINPEEHTVDFVIMFIPNEMIFSFVYERMNDVWIEAMKQKVVMAGPFSFIAILRLVRQAYDNFKYQKNIQKIIGYIKSFEIEFQKYNEEFKIIGDRIESLSKKYNEVDSTRTNQLLKSVDKIKLNESSANTKQLRED
ncbi:hypothetical protein A2954_05100 [Candidatus Roizmanbacteria bacterium RIFCSPLOWO2_01_FULL_37_12]|uniref:Recombinase RmuC n=1 Tax=Candidatus Roizmanbacteria bacterium RIFCSPLOWO2_01_FULL_37_12 TaxID=1802056 RepID=A0A1F7I902_9BACT|nr:MAG: hypothetical protein A2768_02195 [Candidatus Roizmanbacteria bacterium RIFCSPHIGHO2_01_FULL_37_16]OGK39772.1 MAG: hypothetical protein A2954_05100 [Candidatus Roizmanbacteria bacterium RIFCSPLOWO2_01_FULL_37_12]